MRRKKMKNYFVAVIFFLVCTSSAFGASTDGNEVLGKCQTAIRVVDEGRLSQSDSSDSMWCMGWIEGVLDMNRLSELMVETGVSKKGDPYFCAPDGIQVGQAVRVVVKYLQDHPEQLHARGIVLAVAALQKAFPCK